MNAVTVYGLPIVTIGSANQMDDTREVRTFRKGNIYRKLVFEGNRLVGAVLVSAIDYPASSPVSSAAGPTLPA